MAKVATHDATLQQLRQAVTDAEQARDTTMIAAEKANVDLEMAREDLRAAQTAKADNDGGAWETFISRLETFLKEQPDISQVEEVATDVMAGVESSIYGFVLAGAGGVSLMVNITP